MTDEREWGSWSVWKTEILLGGYLPLFTRASQKAPHRTYIDCFAGVTRNLERGTGREIKSSPRLALEASPEFTHLLLFELEEKADRLEETLRSEFPTRTIKVIGGDCNERIEDGLRWWFEQREGNRGPYLGPALAYLDPNQLDLAWSTVEKIARFGMTSPAPGAWVRKKGPIELLILFPTGPLKRMLPQAGKPHASEAVCSRVDRLFGDQSWREIYADQRAKVVTGEDSWAHYVNLYRYKLEQLGYSHTAAIEVRNTHRVVLYHMVFATGHIAGQKIMGSVMDRAREVLPRLLEQERARLERRRRPDTPLFEDDEWMAELSQAAGNPQRYATLLVDRVEPYRSGAVAVEEQLSLDI